MFEKIIMLFVCLLCAGTFFLINIGNRDRKDPVSFWSGDTSLKGKVKDVPSYNREMARMWNRYALTYLAIGVVYLFAPMLGAVLLVLDSTAAIYFLHRAYIKILKKYS